MIQNVFDWPNLGMLIVDGNFECMTSLVKDNDLFVWFVIATQCTLKFYEHPRGSLSNFYGYKNNHCINKPNTDLLSNVLPFEAVKVISGSIEYNQLENVVQRMDNIVSILKFRKPLPPSVTESPEVHVTRKQDAFDDLAGTDSPLTEDSENYTDSEDYVKSGDSEYDDPDTEYDDGVDSYDYDYNYDYDFQEMIPACLDTQKAFNYTIFNKQVNTNVRRSAIQKPYFGENSEYPDLAETCGENNC
jgi:hypothetical protein